MRTISNFSSKATCRVIGGVYDLAWSKFPDVVRIETTNACNAKCVICPHREMTRPIKHMDEDFFRRIIDECAANRAKEIHLHNFGEPLLDKLLEDRVRYAKAQGLRKAKIFSNGSLLNKERARGLIGAGLDELKVSIDGATREEFERIRTPLKFDQVIRNIKDLVAVRDEMQSGLKIRVACCSTSDKNGTMRSLEDVVDDFSFGKIHNWASGDSPQDQNRIRKPCSRLWRTFTILASGDVSLCCLDYDGAVILGRIDQHTSIRDVWNNAAYRRVRLQHKQARQAEISLCKNCTKAFL